VSLCPIKHRVLKMELVLETWSLNVAAEWSASRSRSYFTTDAIRTSQETHYASATEPNLLMLFRGKNAVYCEVRWGYFTTHGRSVGQSECLGIDHPCGTCDQILRPVGMLLSEICGLVSIGRPLWREVESVSYQSLSAVIAHCQVLRWGYFTTDGQSVSKSWYRAPL
jgi:hypothetical protein